MDVPSAESYPCNMVDFGSQLGFLGKLEAPQQQSFDFIFKCFLGLVCNELGLSGYQLYCLQN